MIRETHDSGGVVAVESRELDQRRDPGRVLAGGRDVGTGKL